MKLLIDTNVLIPLEPGSSMNLEPTMAIAAELARTALQIGATLYLHSIQRKDIEQDKESDRKHLRLKLIEKYPELPNPPAPNSAILSEIGNPKEGSNDWIDAHLIAALERDLVDLLVTEDQRIHRRCSRLKVGTRCRTIAQAVARLQDELPSETTPPPAVRSRLAHELNEADPIFSSFRQDYPGFDSWLAKCRLQHRQCWVIELAGRESYAGVCIVNRENRNWRDAYDPTLKICTFKIASDVLGMKLGELMLKTLFDYAAANNFATTFVETFPKQAVLMELLECFGFSRTFEKENGEIEMRKRLRPWGDTSSLSAFEYHQQFGPHRIKTEGAKFFIIPIKPRFHSMLFPDLHPQRQFFEGTESYGNTIRKAYICNSGIRQLKRGSILLFYRSREIHQVDAVGIVEETLRTRDADELEKFTRKRTVYQRKDIESKTSSKEALGILFRNAPVLSDNIPLADLLQAGVLKAAPQSIQSIKEEAVPWIRTRLK